tara:strand:+ start:479 stop:802 length:324 start_codon:yes stop_codon:yes gene_type:complete
MTAISKKTERKAPPKAFKPGQSGNPAGRPKKTPEELDLIAACKAKTPSALAVMVDIMENGEKEATRLQAAQSIIERAYGKPVQPQDVSLTGGLVFTAIERVIVHPKN